jgi:hypothetical protein
VDESLDMWKNFLTMFYLEDFFQQKKRVLMKNGVNSLLRLVGKIEEDATNNG